MPAEGSGDDVIFLKELQHKEPHVPTSQNQSLLLALVLAPVMEEEGVSRPTNHQVLDWQQSQDQLSATQISFAVSSLSILISVIIFGILIAFCEVTPVLFLPLIFSFVHFFTLLEAVL